MRKFLFEHDLPYLFDARIGFVPRAAVVEVALRVFVLQQSRKPCARSVHKAAVVRDVLFLYHGDLQEELLALFRGVGVAHVHVEVHGLLLGGGDYRRVQPRDRIRLFVVAGAAHVVIRITVLRYGGAPRSDLRALCHKPRRVDVHVVHEHVGEAVQMVEVLQQGEIQCHPDVRIFLPPREICGEFDGELFVADRSFQHAFAYGFQRAEFLLLLLFHAADQSDLAAQVVHGAMAGELV